MPSFDEPPAPRPSAGSERRRRQSPSGLEWCTLLHLGIFLLLATWGFGGQAEWLRRPLAAWGSIGAAITLAALLRPGAARPISRSRALWLLAPFALFNAVVLFASSNPSFRTFVLEGETLYANVGGRSWLPSTAVPAAARLALWEFDAIWLATLNVTLTLRSRRALRILLLLFAGNAVLLAIFGTIQKLSGSTGLFFGAVPSPQKYFFASFVYHNHWGAFALLAVATTIALGWHYSRHRRGRDFFHSPGLAVCVALLLLVATIPLSASRSSTLLATAVLTVAFVHWVVHHWRVRRRYNESTTWPLIGAVAALALALGAVIHLSRDTIAYRLALTREQIAASRTNSRKDARVQLYEDTWRMAAAKPWFGWGMASYPHVFTLYNTRQSVDGFPVHYHDAHSDWLQAFAEHGAIGSLLLGAMAAMPVVLTGRRMFNNSVSPYLMLGCGTLVLYAWLEFPFGNFAVVLCWWTCLHVATHYARLTDARDPRAVAPPAT